MWGELLNDIQNEIIIKCSFKVRCLNKYSKKIREEYEIKNSRPLEIDFNDIFNYFIENINNMSNLYVCYFNENDNFIIDDEEFSHSIHNIKFRKSGDKKYDDIRFEMFCQYLKGNLKYKTIDDFVPDINIITYKANKHLLSKILGERYQNNLIKITVKKYLIKLHSLIKNNICEDNESTLSNQLKFSYYVS